jgi:hypothetical protein
MEAKSGDFHTSNSTCLQAITRMNIPWYDPIAKKQKTRMENAFIAPEAR